MREEKGGGDGEMIGWPETVRLAGDVEMIHGEVRVSKVKMEKCLFLNI